jgi:hypothetical protein
LTTHRIDDVHCALNRLIRHLIIVVARAVVTQDTKKLTLSIAVYADFVAGQGDDWIEGRRHRSGPKMEIGRSFIGNPIFGTFPCSLPSFFSFFVLSKQRQKEESKLQKQRQKEESKRSKQRQKEESKRQKQRQKEKSKR